MSAQILLSPHKAKIKDANRAALRVVATSEPSPPSRFHRQAVPIVAAPPEMIRSTSGR